MKRQNRCKTNPNDGGLSVDFFIDFDSNCSELILIVFVTRCDTC